MGYGEAAQDNGVTDMAWEPQGPESPEELLEWQGVVCVDHGNCQHLFWPQGMLQCGSNCRVPWNPCCLA